MNPETNEDVQNEVPNEPETTTAAPEPTPAPETPVAPPTPAPAPVESSNDDWDKATSSDYVEFTEPAIVRFLSEKFAVIPGEGGKVSWEFDVLNEINGVPTSKILGTRSKRLMRELKKLRPLSSKRVLITRAGEGYNTIYTVKSL